MVALSVPARDSMKGRLVLPSTAADLRNATCIPRSGSQEMRPGCCRWMVNSSLSSIQRSSLSSTSSGVPRTTRCAVHTAGPTARSRKPWPRAGSMRERSSSIACWR